jgi:hypothetical protein
MRGHPNDGLAHIGKLFGSARFLGSLYGKFPQLGESNTPQPMDAVEECLLYHYNGKFI